LRVQPEIEIPAGIARHNKQTSVKNRRMNPPRPALSNRGTVPPDTIGKIGLQANFSSPLPAFAGSEWLSLCERVLLRTPQKGNGN
jgi:hypothetical protein